MATELLLQGRVRDARGRSLNYKYLNTSMYSFAIDLIVA